MERFSLGLCGKYYGEEGILVPTDSVQIPPESPNLRQQNVLHTVSKKVTLPFIRGSIILDEPGLLAQNLIFHSKNPDDSKLLLHDILKVIMDKRRAMVNFSFT
jgi:hypothetical protein